jgi:hypothetical protein
MVVTALCVILLAGLVACSSALLTQNPYVEKLKATPGGVGEAAGESVALSDDGQTLAIGAPFYSLTPSLGRVYMYARNATGGWAPQGSFLQPFDLLVSGPTSPLFGDTVALSGTGDLLVVIAFSEPAFWIYTRSNGVWAQNGAKQTVANGYRCHLSLDVAKNGLAFAIGCQSDTDTPSQPLFAVFRLVNDQWVRDTGNFATTDPVITRRISPAHSLVLSQDTQSLLVTSAATDVGLRLFRYSASSGWAQDGSVLKNPVSNAGFFKLASNSDLSKVVVVDQVKSLMFFFSLQGGAYVQKQVLSLPSAYFKALVASADLSRMFVSDPFSQQGGLNIGAVYAYQLNGSSLFTPVPGGPLIPTDYKLAPTGEIVFGYSLAVSADGSVLAVGAYGDDQYSGWLSVLFGSVPGTLTWWTYRGGLDLRGSSCCSN